MHEEHTGGSGGGKRHQPPSGRSSRPARHTQRADQRRGEPSRHSRVRDDSITTGRPGQAARQERPREPHLPDDVTGDMLAGEYRRPLRGLSKENADRVARHLVMVGELLDTEPGSALAHAKAAVQRAGRLAVTHEALAFASYVTGHYTEALRELRTVRRISGRDQHRHLEADVERGLGRPERALAIIADTDVKGLSEEDLVELRIVESAARADLGEYETGLLIIEQPALARIEEPTLRARLDLVRADRLEETGQPNDAAQLRKAVDDAFGPEAMDQRAAAAQARDVDSYELFEMSDIYADVLDLSVEILDHEEPTDEEQAELEAGERGSELHDRDTSQEGPRDASQ